MLDDDVELRVRELPHDLRQILRSWAHRQGDDRLPEAGAAVTVGANHVETLRGETRAGGRRKIVWLIHAAGA